MRTYHDTYSDACGETILHRRRLMLNSAGKLVYADRETFGFALSDIAGPRSAPTTNEPCGLDLLNAGGVLTFCATGAVTKGARLYAADDGKVATTGSLLIGIALFASVIDQDGLYYVQAYVDPGAAEVQYNASASSTAVASTTSATVHDKKLTLPIGGWAVGDLITIRWAGIAGTTGTPTLAQRLLVGSTALMTVAATDPTNGGIFSGEFNGIVRDNGAGVMQITGMGYANVGASASASKNYVLAPTSLDLTAAREIGVETTWSASSSSNTCQLHLFQVMRRKAG